MTNKQKYYIFCETEENIPIFSQAWWLDAVCGTNWDVVLVEHHGDIIASMPYHMKKKTGFNIITMPKLTQNMGPYIKYPDNQKYEKKIVYEKQVMTKLIDMLPECDKFSQNFHYTITNWQPFYWKEFKQSTKYTYVLNDLYDSKLVIKNFSSECRNKIDKAKKIVSVIETDNLVEFYKISRMSFDRQGIKIPYSYNYLKKLDDVCSANRSRKIFFAIDKNNDIHAVVYLIRDKLSVYLLASAGDPMFRSSGAKNILVLEAVKFAKDNGLIFDFEGSMIENVVKYNRSFGAIQKPYFHIMKTSSTLLRVKDAFKEVLLSK